MTGSEFFTFRNMTKVAFLPRDAMHKRGLCRHAVSVRPSVCPFVTFVDSVETNKPGLEKNLGFFYFFSFLGFLGFNVHNAEHRHMTHDK